MDMLHYSFKYDSFNIHKTKFYILKPLYYSNISFNIKKCNQNNLKSIEDVFYLHLLNFITDNHCD